MIKPPNNKVKFAELQLAAFLAEHTSIITVDHLTELLKKIEPDSDVFSKMKLHRTKCAALIKNILGPCMLEDLMNDMKESPYSLIIDESTDISTEKVLCIMVRYFSFKKKKLLTTFYRIVKIVDATATGIHSALKLQLEADGLSLKNLVGIGVDGANVMVGVNHSVSSLLKEEVPDIVIIKCICHSLHLCAENAAETLPRQLEYLVREAHNWFSNSPKRKDEYKKLYKVMNGDEAKKDPKKIAGLSGTRWLARYSAINTILEQWEELKLLFELAKNNDKCLQAQYLYDIMVCPAYKLFMVFLHSNLELLTNLNKLFQSSNVEIFKLLEDLFLLYKSILQKIVVPSQLQKVKDADLVTFKFQDYLMHTSSIFFGYNFDQAAKSVPSNEISNIRARCKDFLVKLCTEIQERLPMNISILKSMNVLTPTYATSQRKPDISKLLEQFTRESLYGSKDNIIKEWNMLSNKQWDNTDETVLFWSEVYEDRDSGGNRRFENVAKFALALLTTPISNADVERAFSIYAVIKDKLRNKLALEMVQSIMMVKFSLKRDYEQCTSFVPTKEMLSRFTVHMYDFKNDTEKVNDVEFQELLTITDAIYFI